MATQSRFKWKPSIIASAAIFFIHGWKMVLHHEWRSEMYTQKWVIIVILFSAAYYYCLSLTADQLYPPKNNSSYVIFFDWVIQVGQYIGFFYLWELLNYKDLVGYSVLMCGINASYLYWDFVHFEAPWKNNNFIFWCDCAGIVLNGAMFFILQNLPQSDINLNSNDILQAIIVAVVGALVIIQSIIGFIYAIVLLNRRQVVTNTDTKLGV